DLDAHLRGFRCVLVISERAGEGVEAACQPTEAQVIGAKVDGGMRPFGIDRIVGGGRRMRQREGCDQRKRRRARQHDNVLSDWVTFKLWEGPTTCAAAWTCGR